MSQPQLASLGVNLLPTIVMFSSLPFAINDGSFQSPLAKFNPPLWGNPPGWENTVVETFEHFSMAIVLPSCTPLSYHKAKAQISISSMIPCVRCSTYSKCEILSLLVGVISKGSQGSGAPLLRLLIILGGSAPQKFLHRPCFSKFIDLASKAFSIAIINYV